MAEKVQKVHGHRSLLITIGSASVGGALMVEHKTGVPELSYVKRVPIGGGSEGERVLPDAMKTALTALMKEYEPFIRHGSAYVVFAAPWYHAKIRTIRSGGDTSVSVSLRSVEQLIAKYKNEAPPATGRADLEAVAVQVTVNGYPTSLVRPVEGSAVSVNLYESEIDATTRASVAAVIARSFPGVAVSLHSFPLIAATALRVISPETDFSFADIGGEVTDFGIVHEDGIHFLASFPIGFQTVIRTVKGSGVDTASRLALYARNELSPEEGGTVETAFIPAFKAWTDACESALKQGSEEVPIPRSLFLISDAEPLLWLAKGVAGVSPAHVTAVPVDPPLFQKFITTGAEGLYDAFLGLSAIFFHIAVTQVIGENKPGRLQ